MHANLDRLRNIKTLPQLAAYLRDELDWPIESDNTEDITFDYEAAELGLDEKTAVRIKEIKQLRPLTGSQPWGIFFINFEKKRLPVVVMRRILRALIFKKRASVKAAERQAWQPSDLLFISAYGEDDDRAITFAHFVEDTDLGGLAELRVLGWDDDDTPLKYDYVAQMLQEKLRWRSDYQGKPDEWRKTWREAFVLRHREVIKTSEALALALADLAKKIRGRVRSVLRYEDGFGEIRKLQRAFQTALIHDLTDEGFADMFAQTVTYGLFSLACRRTIPGEGTAFVKEDLSHYFTSPFLREMLGIFLGLKSRKGKIDFDELGIADVTDFLQNPDTHMEAVLRDFGNKTRGEDPVIHFYELFLSAYNKQLKIQRGVFYTPQPVVSYIVRSVHELLQTEFGLADGLADTTTWGEMLNKHPGLKLPPLTDEPNDDRTISPDEPFVQILDPATGTATFLVEVIDVIHRTLAAKWKLQRFTDAQQSAAWNAYVPKHLLPRLHAFELMMAPYAIAHMKIGLKLAETGYQFDTEERARIYLTNALEPKVKQLPQIGFDALAHEAAAVNEIKWYKRFTVVIGNPPYSGHSTNIGPWITSMVNDYYFVDGQPLDEKNTKWLLDDYVKFVRLGEKAVSTSGCRVLGYITNHGFIDNPTFRGMRAHLLKSFTQLSALDLHGNAKKVAKTTAAKTDENVFDIQQGVAITLGVRFNGSSSARHANLVGSRLEKYAELAGTTVSTTSWETVQPVAPFYVLELHDADLRDEYEAAVKVTEVFPLNGWGIATRKDYLLVDFDRDALVTKFKDIVSAPAKKSIEKYEIQESPHWDFAAAIPKLPKTVEKSVRPLLFRPFDTRYVYYERAMIERGDHRYPLMRHMLQPNVCFITIRRLEVGGGFEHTFCADQLSVLHSISMKEGNFVFPLFVYPDEVEPQGTLLAESERRPNFGSGFLKSLAAKLGLKPDGKWHLPVSLTSEDIFHYAYAVFHSPCYRSRYAEFLKIDFPRLPLTGSLELFRALARFGGELTALHLLESPKLAQPITEYLGGRNTEVEKISWSKNTVWVDKAQTTGFKGVREDVWNFHIGGYQVCQKWLKDRRGRTLTKDDLAHYQKIIIALSETIRLMKEIDVEIDKHGGWPGAFVGATTPPDENAAPPEDPFPKTRSIKSGGEGSASSEP